MGRRAMGRRDRSAACAARARGRGLGMAVVAVLAGCGSSSGTRPDARGAEEPVVWQPKPGEAPNWDIQLAPPFDVSAPRTMYDLDLWSLVPVATMLDYGDGAPVMVPAGPLAGTIAQLHARTPPAIVICHVETGMLDLDRPDAKKFPGFKDDHKQIPDNPGPPSSGAVPGSPESGSVIGWSLGNVDLRFLDISPAGRAKLAPILFKRFDLAAQIGCDGIDPAHDDNAAFAASTGFTLTSDDALSWLGQVAQEGHARKLSTGVRYSRMEVIDAEVNQFDWLIFERCGELTLQDDQGGSGKHASECDPAQSFLGANKDVFAIDYSTADGSQTHQDPAKVCAPQVAALIVDGLYKDFPPSGDATIRQQCQAAVPPPMP